MSRFTIRIAPIAKKQIDSLPDNVKSRVFEVLSSVLSEDPFLGKALKAELKGLYSYRVGDYRIIYSIIKRELIVQVLKVMHRREVYR